MQTTFLLSQLGNSALNALVSTTPKVPSRSLIPSARRVPAYQ